MATEIVLPLANYPAGTRNFGPIAIADGVTVVDFSVRRCTTAEPNIWPSNTVSLSIQMEMSVDGGATWRGISGFTAVGGIALDRDGTEATVSRGGGNLPPGTNRQARCTVTIAGGVLRSSATLEIT